MKKLSIRFTIIGDGVEKLVAYEVLQQEGLPYRKIDGNIKIKNELSINLFTPTNVYEIVFDLWLRGLNSNKDTDVDVCWTESPYELIDKIKKSIDKEIFSYEDIKDGDLVDVSKDKETWYNSFKYVSELTNPTIYGKYLCCDNVGGYNCSP